MVQPLVISSDSSLTSQLGVADGLVPAVCHRQHVLTSRCLLHSHPQLNSILNSPIPITGQILQRHVEEGGALTGTTFGVLPLGRQR